MPAADNSHALLLEDRFAIVPEWLLDAEIGDAAVRLYAVLLRYGQSSGARMPSRATLARRLRKKSTDSVDRAMKELVAIGAVQIEHRYDGAQRLTNAYHLSTSRPGRAEAPTPDGAGSRKSATTPTKATRGDRKDAGRVAADSGHDPEHLTQSTTSSPSAARAAQFLSAVEEGVASECGVDWLEFVEEVQQVRRRTGASATRWAGTSLAAALQLATRTRGWPAEHATAALRQVAADPTTRSPMRVAEAGPWWDEKPDPTASDEDLQAMENALLEAGGVRIDLQTRARRKLEAAELPVTREAVVRGAYRLLTKPDGSPGAA